MSSQEQTTIGERIFSILFLLAVTIFFISTFQYDMYAKMGGIGEGFMPRIISFLLLLFLIYYGWNVFRSKRKSDEKFNRKSLINQMILGVMLVATVFLINRLGMLSALWLFMVVTLVLTENLTWVRSIIFSTCSTVGIYLIFIQWLGIRLPSGLLL